MILIVNSFFSFQRNVCGEFFFPSSEEVQDSTVPQRQVTIPIFFAHVAMYKQILIGALKGKCNVIKQNELELANTG